MTTHKSQPASAPPSKRPKSLPLAPAEATLVPARMINELLYCERLMVLEWIHGEWAGNAFTSDGTRVHKRVDAGRGKLSEPESDSATDAERYVARSVWLSSEALGITAKLDVVDVRDGEVIAVEYKRGKRPKIPERAYLPERAQLCAHVLLLRAHGYTCDRAEIYFAGDHQRVSVDITDELVRTTQEAVQRARELAATRSLPPPLESSPKCAGCSLNAICLPDEVNWLKDSPTAAQADEPSIDGSPGPCGPKQTTQQSHEQHHKPRRLQAPLDHRQPLYVTAQGASVRVSGKVLSVHTKTEKVEVGLPHTSHVALFGNAQISTQAIRSLLTQGIPIHYFTYGGWWVGATMGADSNNVQLREAQHRATLNEPQRLKLARAWVHGKIQNCRTLLRRNLRAPRPVALGELKQLANKALVAESEGALLGIEGSAARVYFREFPRMFTSTALTNGFTLEGRNRRPPKDPLNAMLSFGYSLLTKDVLAGARAAGLDPLFGFYHKPRFGRPSLALDLMEEFRPLISDSVVLHAVNNGEIHPADFTEAAGAFALSATGRKSFLRCYERRLQHEVTHPVFGYKMSYRRVMEIQARLLARYLLGEIPEYPGFRTR